MLLISRLVGLLIPLLAQLASTAQRDKKRGDKQQVHQVNNHYKPAEYRLICQREKKSEMGIELERSVPKYAAATHLSIFECEAKLSADIYITR